MFLAPRPKLGEGGEVRDGVVTCIGKPERTWIAISLSVS